MRYEFLYEGPLGAIVRLCGLGRRFSNVELTADTLHVRMGWGFRAHIPRASIRSAAISTARPISRGAHGWRGRWLVNGSRNGLVTITIDPPARGWTLGFPIRVHQLTVSLEAPAELLEALGLQ